MDIQIFQLPKVLETRVSIESPRSVVNWEHSMSPNGIGSLQFFIGSPRQDSIDSNWTNEILNLRQCVSIPEVLDSIRAIRLALNTMDKSDRSKQCKADVVNAFKYLQKKKKVWNNSLFTELADIISTFFDENKVKVIPATVLKEILQYLDLSDFAHVPAVSKEFQSICASNEIWSMLYVRKFLRRNPFSDLPQQNSNYLALFRSRFEDPELGDNVEVSWNGKFRLESRVVYRGLAWWVGVVVDKHASQKKYKIHYPGWDDRWDEWVPRERLRWSVERNTLESIRVNDNVELWCHGSSVPGAWLQTQVIKVKNGRYCISQSSYNVWVSRERLRRIKTEESNHERLSRKFQNLTRRLSLGNRDEAQFGSSCITM